LTVALAQVSQFAVAGNECPAATTVPLTATSAGRSALVPLAYLMVSWYVPAWSALTVTWDAAPTALVVLQNPVPENPVWLLSTVPSQVPLSASTRVAGGGVVPSALAYAVASHASSMRSVSEDEYSESTSSRTYR